MRRAIVGVIGLLLAFVLILLTSCKNTDPARRNGETVTIHLQPGQKLVSCGWDDVQQLWYLTKPLAPGEAATEYEYRTEGPGLVVFKEEAIKGLDTSAFEPGGDIDQDPKTLHQLRKGH